MEPLTPSDVKRWDPDAIHTVFQTASGRADTLQRLGENLHQVHNVLSDWHGEAGEAFRVDLGKVRRDIEADGAESRRVAAAVSRAEADVRACKAELDDIQRAADANSWTITLDWRIDVGDTWIGSDPIDFAAEQQLLQNQLNALKVHAHSADHELATAIRAAVGEIQLDPTVPGPHNADTGAQPGTDTPRTWQDMLLPAGAAGPVPGGDPRPGAPNPAGGAGDKPPSMEDLLLPTGRPQSSDQAPVPGSLPDLLSRLHQPVPAGAPAPRLSPADVESGKAILRQIMATQGVPPDQIEAQVDAIVARTQQWMDNGMPNYVPPEPPRPPPPGLAEGFGDRWRATEQGIKNLIGQGGPGAPGVLESWEQMLKGTTEIAQNPVGAAIGEVKNAFDSPSLPYYLGEKGSDGAFALPGLLFGPEGAATGELGDLGAGAIEYGPTHSPIGFEHPVAYHPWAEQAAIDLNDAFVHGQPTADFTQQVADLSTHYVGDNPDRVILGKFDGQEDGYIGEARRHGGIYFDTGNPTWDAIIHGLTEPQAQNLAWQANERFLRQQMENHVSRIEYILPDGFDSVDEVARVRRESFSALEINYLNQNAAKFGYKRVGNAWVYEGG